VSPVTVITAAELARRIIQATNPHVSLGLSLFADGNYAMPTHDYVANIMLPAFRGWMDRNGLTKWLTRHDCDDKGDSLKVFAQTCFAASHEDTDADGFAVVRVFYHIGGDSAKGHAINAALTDRGFEFIEPQTAQIVKLNEMERESIWHVY